jgi:hypothetical protein
LKQKKHEKYQLIEIESSEIYNQIEVNKSESYIDFAEKDEFKLSCCDNIEEMFGLQIEVSLIMKEI